MLLVDFHSISSQLEGLNKILDYVVLCVMTEMMSKSRRIN